MKQERLLTIRDLSNLISIPEKTIRNWIYLRRIPFIKIGRLIRFRTKDIDRWLRWSEVRPGKNSHYFEGMEE